ncbi:uncharacterized protein N7484_004083 [Penicillium longicatenatum]|uniref:uncharacterized protein n=1 Tax=Penicillium longicatenatum TaxID=1561947 RepID=UPI0025497F2C|nr:uncharacterized protein N7484_004083 [Penicillium longicatenatum]KAJ5650360.1 hypothetical protein N7484_004083 [Penicillium longicatenatum]
MMVKIATFISAFLSLGTFALTESIPQTDYDVIIVGGGPAGLSALSGVSRVRRTALLIDSQHYRNDPTREMHDVIGNDGTPLPEFRGAAREQISRYPTAHFRNSTVLSVQSIGDGTVSAFNVSDNTGSSFTSRKLVLGTGLTDVLPDTPGIKEAWGKGVFWCPWCDGYEHRDQPFGILTDVAGVLDDLLEVNTQYSDIIAFVNGTQTAEGEAAATAKNDGWKEQLEAWNVKIDNRTITRLERTQDGGDHRDEENDLQFDKFLLHFSTGDPVERDAFIIDVPTVQHSQLPSQMKLKMTDHKIDVVASSMRTSQAGVWAVGDCNGGGGATNVPHAMFTGKKAAVYLHVEMSREDSHSKVSKRSGLSETELVEEATRAIGDKLERKWEEIQKRSNMA